MCAFCEEQTINASLRIQFRSLLNAPRHKAGVIDWLNSASSTLQTSILISRYLLNAYVKRIISDYGRVAAHINNYWEQKSGVYAAQSVDYRLACTVKHAPHLVKLYLSPEFQMQDAEPFRMHGQQAKRKND